MSTRDWMCVCAILLLMLTVAVSFLVWREQRREQQRLDWDLMRAVMTCDVRRVNVLLSKGADTAQTEADGSTLLHYAARTPSPEIAEMLIAHGANANAVDDSLDTPLHSATKWNVRCDFGDEAFGIVRALLDGGANPNAANAEGATPLHYMAWWGPNETTRLLISRGAAPSIVDAILLEEFQKASDELKAHPRNINALGPRGLRPLHAAGWVGDLELGRWLINEGADVNARSGDGTTPLILLAGRARKPGKSRLEFLELLLAWGADPEATSQNYGTALHGLAPAKGTTSIAMARLLLDRGANVNARDRDGNTPLHLACRSGRMEMVKLLLEAGADPGIDNNSDSTPMDYAKQYRHIHLVVLDYKRRTQGHGGDSSRE